jgi:hypothetical protein
MRGSVATLTSEPRNTENKVTPRETRHWQPVLWINLIGSAAAGAAFWINRDNRPVEFAYGCWAISALVAAAILYNHYATTSDTGPDRDEE